MNVFKKISLLVLLTTINSADALKISWCGDGDVPTVENITFQLSNLTCKSSKLNTTLYSGLIESETFTKSSAGRDYNATGILKLTGHLKLNRTTFIHPSQYCVSKLWNDTELNEGTGYGRGEAEYCDQEGECGINGHECIPLCCPPDLLFTHVKNPTTKKLSVVCQSSHSSYPEPDLEKLLKALEKPGTKTVSYLQRKENECSDRSTVTTFVRYHKGHWNTREPQLFRRKGNGDYELCNQILDEWKPMRVYCLNIDSTTPGRPSDVGIEEMVISECVKKLDKNSQGSLWYRQYYAWMMIIGSLFQLIAFVVYAMIWRRLAFGSRIIMGYCFSLFFLYLIFGIRYYYISDYGAKAFNTTACQIIGIFGHYAWMSTFSWLLLINLNLFFIIWRPVAINPGFRAPSEKWRIARYALFGWGLPGMYVLICVFIDVSHDREEDRCTTPAPLYGHKDCYVSPAHAGLFVYLPSAIILALNLILFIAATAKLYSPKQAKTLCNSSNRPQLFRIYGRMFLVAGMYWIMELVVWSLKRSGIPHARRDMALHTIKFLLTFLSFVIFVTGSNITKPLLQNYGGVRDSATWASGKLSRVSFFSRTSFSKDNNDTENTMGNASPTTYGEVTLTSTK